MTARFEFEIDTSHAIESWEKEVAENLRRRAEDEAKSESEQAGVS
jgi:3-ketosteroid 9alpha-monooxygenase subunit A